MALVFIALFLPGPPPRADDTSAALTANLVEHRTALVTGVLVAAAGVVALLWFFGVLAERLQFASDHSRYTHAAVAGGVVGLVLLFIGMLLFSGTAFRAATMGDEAVVRATVDTGNMLIEASKYGFAVLIVATAAASIDGPLLSQRMTRMGLISAAILVVSTIPPFVTDHGLGQFGGAIDVFGGLPGFLWIMVLSVQLARRSDVVCS
jgi:hypothetical protein